MTIYVHPYVEWKIVNMAHDKKRTRGQVVNHCIYFMEQALKDYSDWIRTKGKGVQDDYEWRKL